MKLTLTKVYTTDKDKQGNPLMSKQGRPYTRMSIKANEYGDKYISGFQNAQTKNWKVGDTVEAEVEQKGEYLNFSVPKQTGNEDTTKILNILTTMNLTLQIIKEGLNIKSKQGAVPLNGVEYPEEELLGLDEF